MNQNDGEIDAEEDGNAPEECEEDGGEGYLEDEGEEKLVTKSSKTDAKSSKPVHEKSRSESSKERGNDVSKERGNDVSKHLSKPTHSSSNKHKSQSSKTNNDEKSSTSTKLSSKHEAVGKEDQVLKSDSSVKPSEAKDGAARESHPGSKNATTSKPVSSSHRTRSNSTSGRDSSQKDKRSSRKDEKSHSDDSTSSSTTNSDAKAALRSSRSRKSNSDTPSTSATSPEAVHSKKDKSKVAVETPQRQRQSERVCKATEKAIASGLVSRRSKAPHTDSDSPNRPEKQVSEKAQDSGSDDTSASQRRSKRKADSQPASKEEAPVSKRRTTRSGDAQSSNETPETTSNAQLLKSARKSKSLKRKGSSGDLPPAKQAHTEESSPKEKVPKEFIADIPKMCRICGSKNENLLNVFGPEGRTMQLSEKVHSILPIKIREEEPLPTGVCHSCVVTLMACEKLVEKCLNIDNLLRVHYECPVDKPSEEKKEDQPQLPSSEQNQNPDPTPEKSVKAVAPASPQPVVKPSDTSVSTLEEKPAPKAGHVTRSSSRVSAKSKQVESSKAAEVPSKAANKVASQELAKTGKANLVDTEDSPPVLEAEPPQSHVPASNQEPSAQPPVLVPQPGKSGSAAASAASGEDPSAKRFGNTYHVRMKPTQWEKIERGLEAIHGESQDDAPEAAPSDPKRYGTITTEEFHIVDLDMNVEEVPPEEPLLTGKSEATSAMQEFHIEIPADTPEEETSVQQSSPKSVIDSILVDWSGDEDEATPVQKAYACHLCDKVCQKRIALIEHLRKHTGDNPFACPVCNKRFNRLANYKAHMVIHENARRYECPYCGKRFNRQSIQQRHIKTHTTEQSRKHRCRVCNLTFGLATEMFTHRRLHTREEVERATWEDEKLRLALTSFPCTSRQVIEDSSASSSKSEKHDLYEEFEDEDFEEDDDDEDEYIIYEDEDGVDDDDDDGDIDEGDEKEMSESSLKEDSLTNLTKIAFVDTSKSSNGVDLPVTNITPIPVTLSGDAVPSVGDSSVHITIL
ncbi:hypothetical protein ONE63_001483 [Megalurothrips usitatus]|uniref:Uncharacterized protein n=1 Tax=Megalurothrips usitatus TaxID=439358 RepID=A0AAV7XIS8_9NEOP|nr:hypothetical protein ONE63_001483 [Megalurothrips usitatus]